MSAMTLLSVQGLGMRFGGLAALEDVTFEVPQGSVVSIIGPNGSGKSTMFNCINGILEPTAGSIHFDGTDLLGVKGIPKEKNSSWVIRQ